MGPALFLFPFSFLGPGLLGWGLGSKGDEPGTWISGPGLGKTPAAPPSPGRERQRGRVQKGAMLFSVARHRDFGPNAPLRFAPMAAGEGFGAGAPETFTRSRGATSFMWRGLVKWGSSAARGTCEKAPKFNEVWDVAEVWQIRISSLILGLRLSCSRGLKAVYCMDLGFRGLWLKGFRVQRRSDLGFLTG